MSLYEYQCNACSRDFEVLVRGDEDIHCLECGSRDLTRKISAFGFSIGDSKPVCSAGCEGGLEKGRCGSSMCGV